MMNCSNIRVHCLLDYSNIGAHSIAIIWHKFTHTKDIDVADPDKISFDLHVSIT